MSEPKPRPSPIQIKANLKSLQDQGAPEDVIDRYMASVGATPVDQAPPSGHGFAGSTAVGEKVPTPSNPYTSADAYINGVSGYEPEIAAALKTKSLFHGPEYSQELARNQEGQRQYGKAHPVGNAVSNAIGMAPVAVLTSGGSLARNLATQGALGAWYGAGNAGQGNRGTGAIVGGGLGLAGGALMHGAMGALQAVAESGPALTKAGRFLHLLPSAEQKGDQLLNTRFGQDRKPINTLAQVVQSQPDVKPEALLDMGGTNVRGLARKAYNTPGESQNDYTAFAKQRGSNNAVRAGNDLTSVGVNPVNQYETMDQLIAAQKANAAPLYEKALSGTVNDPRLNKLIQDYPELQAAMAKANTMARGENLTTELGGGELPPTASGEGIPAGTLHRMKLALDDMVKYGYVEPGGSGSTVNRVDKGVAAAFRKRLGEIIPGYDEAAGQFSGDIGATNAFESGTGHLADEGAKSAHEIGRLTPGDKQMYKLGAGANLRTAASKVGAKGDVGAKLMGNEFRQGQVQSLLDDPAAYDQFKGLMDRESNMALNNNLQNISATGQLAQETAAPKAFSQLIRGHPFNAFGTLLDRRASDPTVLEAAGKRLLAGSQGGRPEILSAIEAIQKSMMPTFQKKAAIANLIAAMAGAGTGASVR